MFQDEETRSEVNLSREWVRKFTYILPVWAMMRGLPFLLGRTAVMAVPPVAGRTFLMPTVPVVMVVATLYDGSTWLGNWSGDNAEGQCGQAQERFQLHGCEFWASWNERRSLNNRFVEEDRALYRHVYAIALG